MTHRRRAGGIASLLLMLVIAAAGVARAEEERAGWSFLATPFVWLPAVQGAVTARGITANVDVDFTNLFDLMGDGDLFAAGGHVEATYDRWTLFLDAFGGTVRPATDVAFGPQQRLTGTADMTIDFTFVEFGPAYRVLEWPRGGAGRPISIDALAGGRFMYFYESLTLRGSRGIFQREANATDTWVDPFVGGRFSVPLGGALDVVFRGDIGGFGAGSQLAWNLVGGFQYELPWQPWGARTALVAVYKALDFDYQTGSGPSRTNLALGLRGPALGLAFRF